jgi:hypothetical protein
MRQVGGQTRTGTGARQRRCHVQRTFVVDKDLQKAFQVSCQEQ